MALFDTLPVDVIVETMRGVDDVLRAWLKQKTGLSISYASFFLSYKIEEERTRIVQKTKN